MIGSPRHARSSSSVKITCLPVAGALAASRDTLRGSGGGISGRGSGNSGRGGWLKDVFVFSWVYTAAVRIAGAWDTPAWWSAQRAALGRNGYHLHII